MREGDNENLDAKFIRCGLYEERMKTVRTCLNKIGRQYKEKAVIIKNQRQPDK